MILPGGKTLCRSPAEETAHALSGAHAQPADGRSRVAILLCTYNGARFLAQQLDSIAAQTHGDWVVWASDDGSSDATLEILEAYRARWEPGRLLISRGPGKGFVAHFLALTCRAGVEADCYAYADQDDIWEADKLARAVDWLLTKSQEVPALYCTRTRTIDINNNDTGFSPVFSRPPGFRNALIQNIAGGNTMVFNHAARLLLSKAGETIQAITHDWWAYMVITGAGGSVILDPYASVRYRQHEGNLIGVNMSWASRLVRNLKVWQGRFRAWNTANIASLRGLGDLLTPENRVVVERFAAARERGLVPRMAGLWQAGIYRQTRLGNLGLFLAALFGKV